MPIPNSFATLTYYLLLTIPFPFGCLVDERVIGDYFLAFRAGNLVGHFLSFLGKFPDRAEQASFGKFNSFSNHLISEAPFVVIPAHHFDKVPINDPGHLQIHDRGAWILNNI